MTKWIPNTTGSQLMRLRVRPYDEALLPLTCSIFYGVGDTWATGSISCSVVDYDSNDFLNLSASLYEPNNTSVIIEVYQVSASNEQYKKLYQGNIQFLDESVTTRTSEPFTSYTGSKTEYIIF